MVVESRGVHPAGVTGIVRVTVQVPAMIQKYRFLGTLQLAEMVLTKEAIATHLYVSILFSTTNA